MIKKSFPIPKFNFTCPSHKEPLNFICMHEDCEVQGLICVQCEYESHQHPINSLGCILEEIAKDVQTQENNVLLLSQIDRIYEEALAKGEKLMDKGSRKLLLETIQQYYSAIATEIVKSSEKAKWLLSLENPTISHFNKELLSYKFQPREQHQKNLSNSEIQIKNRFQAFSESVKDMEEAIKAEESIDKILILFSIDDGKKTKYQFSPDKKNKDIILVDKLNAKMKDGYSYRVALLEPPIRKQNGKTFKKSVNFKIGKISAIIAVGMCYTKKVSDLNYVFSAYSQHGCYFIANNGYTYNESNSQYNSQIKNWTFQKDDVINVTINPKDKKIQFKKEENTFQMPYQERSEFELSFGVMLCCSNETVEIVHG